LERKTLLNFTIKKRSKTQKDYVLYFWLQEPKMKDPIVRIRSTPNSNFTIVPNEAIDALGEEYPAALALLVRLIRLPEDWHIRVRQLMQTKPDKKNLRNKGCGRDAIRSNLNVLKKFGYVKFVKERDKNGCWFCYYDVYSQPQKNLVPNTSTANKTSIKKVGFQKFIPETPKQAPVNTSPSIKLSIQKDPPPSSPLPEEIKPEKSESPVSLRSEEEDSFYECLNETTLSHKEKKRISRAYLQHEVEKALRISKTVNRKGTLMGLLLNILSHPENWQEKDSSTQVSPKQNKALEYNKKLEKADHELAKKNQEAIPKGYVNVLYPALGPTTLSMKADDFEQDLNLCEKYLEEKTREKCPGLKDPYDSG
jgi:hypothetical protein